MLREAASFVLVDGRWGLVFIGMLGARMWWWVWKKYSDTISAS